MYLIKLRIDNFVFAVLIIFLFLNSCQKESFTTKTLHVETGEVKEITTTSAKVSGIILGIGEGIIDYGHCWSLNDIPTIDDYKISQDTSTIVDTFWTTMEYLKHNSTYFVRAYLYDGSDYAYGEIQSFMTQKITFIIQAPTSGEEIDDETDYELKWLTIGDVENVNIYYEEDAGSENWLKIVENLSNIGSYVWNVPAISSGYWQQCRIKIESNIDSEIFAVSHYFWLRKL